MVQDDAIELDLEYTLDVPADRRVPVSALQLSALRSIEQAASNLAAFVNLSTFGPVGQDLVRALDALKRVEP